MGKGKGVSRTMPVGTPVWVYDATLNDSDKSFTVPANKRWHLLGVRYQITASATVGTRTTIVSLTNGANVIETMGRVDAAATQTSAGRCGPQMGYTVSAPLNLLGSAGNPTGKAQENMFEDMWLPAGYVIRVYDAAAVDAAADDLTVILHIEELDV